MKFLKTSVLALTMMAGSTALFAQTADELVQKHVAAIGGADAWKKVTGMKMEGSINAGGMEIPVVMTNNGKAVRMDLTINGMANYTIITEKEGWMYFPIQGQTKAEPMTPEMVSQSQDQLELRGDLMDYKEKGSKIELVGKDDVDGTETFKLKLTTSKGIEKMIYLDAANYYLIRETKKMKADGKEMDMTMNFSNFQKLPAGIVFPMTVESPQGPVTFKSVEVNPKIEDSMFKPTN
jgi:outer membrane lipoprotein-sorting protein